MLLGMPTLFEFHSIKENILFAKEQNFDFIELNVNIPYVYEELMNHLLSVKKELEDAQMKTTLHFLDEPDLGGNPIVLEGYQKLFEMLCNIGKTLGSKQINVHLNTGSYITTNGKKFYIHENDFLDYYERLYKNLKHFQMIAHQNQMELVIENLKGELFIQKTFERLQEEFYFTYDIGHDYTDENRLKNFYFNHNFKIKEFHFHDATTKNPHLGLGFGTMPLKEYKDIILEDTYVVLEVKEKSALIESRKVFPTL